MIWHYGFPIVSIRHYAGTMVFLNKALFGTMYFQYIGVLGRVRPGSGRAWVGLGPGLAPALGPGPVLARAGSVPRPGRDGFGSGLGRARRV
jgi:hypothetical protein